MIESINISEVYETCERYTYFVNLVSAEGFTMTASSHCTGSVYTKGEGLSREEARDRALIDAADWGDYLQIEPKKFGYYEPSMKMNRYTTRRKLELNRKTP